MSKMFVHYKGTVAEFKAANLESTYANHIVFIKGGETSGNGEAVYTHGQYYANVKDALAALQTKVDGMSYFSKIKVGETVASAPGADGTITFSAEDPSVVTVNVDAQGIKVGLKEEFVKAVNENLPADIAAAKKAGEDAAAAVDAKLGAKDAAAASGADATAFGRIKNLEDVVAGLTGTGEGEEVQSVGAQITNAINALDVDAAEGDFVASISQADGKIVPVMGTFAFDAEGAAAQALQDAKDYADGLKTTIDAAYAQADATNLQAAKDYADGLAGNYDEAGAAAAVQGNLDTEVLRAKAAEEANAAAIKVEKERMDAFMLSAEVGEAAVDTLKEIQSYITSDGTAAAKMAEDIATAQAAADAAQGEVDALEGVVAGVKATADAAATKTELSEAKQEITDIITENERVVSEALTDLNTRTAELEGKKATIESALQAADIVSGSANGTISVKGSDIAVTGLGSAAYTEASAYATAAQGALADAAAPQATTYTKTEVDAMWEWEEI